MNNNERNDQFFTNGKIFTIVKRLRKNISCDFDI